MSCIQVQGLFVWGKVLQNVNVMFVLTVSVIIQSYSEFSCETEERVLYFKITCDVCAD